LSKERLLYVLENTESLWNVGFGKTLCELCHKELHSLLANARKEEF
jgi:hypothetical protein